MNKENKYYLLLHPLAISALILLLLNDHFLKIFSPGFITGKLSDFAGLFVFPIYLSAITKNVIKNRFRVEIIIAFSAVLFIALQVESILKFIFFLADIFSFPRPNLVADYTDLTALIMLPLSYRFIKSSEQKTRLIFNRYIYVVILFIYTFAVTATSFVYYFTILPNETYGETEEVGKILFFFEQSLNEQKHEIIHRNKSDGKYRYTVNFNLELLKGENTEYEVQYLIAYIEFDININKDNLVLSKIELITNNSPILEERMGEEILAEKLIKNYILIPFKEKLN